MVPIIDAIAGFGCFAIKEKVLQSESLGAVPGDPDATPPQPLRSHAVSARCENGFLVVEPAADLALKPLPGGSMHYHDYGLFYADVRANAATRISAYLRQTHKADGQWSRAADKRSGT